MLRTLFFFSLIAVLGACSWGIKLNDSGNHVRVAWDGNASGCKEIGELSVSVADKVSFYQRNDIKVSDELEVLARNEAATMHADTIIPRSKPVDGEQRFGAFICGNKPHSNVERPSGHGVETYPIKDH